jgi:hypothetical protein
MTPTPRQDRDTCRLLTYRAGRRRLMERLLRSLGLPRSRARHIASWIR